MTSPKSPLINADLVVCSIARDARRTRWLTVFRIATENACKSQSMGRTRRTRERGDSRSTPRAYTTTSKALRGRDNENTTYSGELSTLR